MTANLTGGVQYAGDAYAEVRRLMESATIIPESNGSRLRVSGPIKQGNARELLDAYLASSPQGTDYSRFVTGLFRRIDDLLTFGDDQGSFLSGIPVVTLPDAMIRTSGGVLTMEAGTQYKGLPKLLSDSSDTTYTTSRGQMYKLGMFLNRRDMSQGDLIAHELQHTLTTLLGDAKLVEKECKRNRCRFISKYA